MPFQIPTPQFSLPPALYQRRLKSAEVLSYRVKGTRTGFEGDLEYEYRMRLQTERLAKTKNVTEVKESLRVDAVLSNMKATFELGRHDQPGRFGVVSMYFSAAGVPQSMSAGGPTFLYVFPMLAFSTPPSSIARDWSFQVAPFKILESGAFEGIGKIVQVDRDGVVVKYDLHFTPLVGKAGHFTCQSIFAPYTGRLRYAKGNFTGEDGKFDFEISD